MFTVGDSFSCFSALAERVLAFERNLFVQLYVRRLRSIEAAAKRAPKRNSTKI